MEPGVRQWTLRGLLAIIIVGAVVVCLALPTVHRMRRERQERAASACMRAIATAEADFRSNDRDNDRAQNFWTHDVVGLYSLCPSTDGTTVPAPQVSQMIRLIEPSLAAADVTGFGDATPGVVAHDQAFGSWAPRRGYVFRAFQSYVLGAGTARYGVPGGIAAWGDTRNFGKYAFQALPVERSEGSVGFIMDETITISRFAISSEYRASWSSGRLEWTNDTFNRDTPFPSSPGGSGWVKIE